MAKASDNAFPSVLLVEGSAPASPATGDQRLFLDTADHKLKRVNSSGTVTSVEGGSSGTTPVLQLDYTLATDTTVALTQNAWTDFLANQTFSVAAGTSLVEVCVQGFVMVGAGAVAEMGARLVVDSAGTPINKSVSGAVNPSSGYVNVLSGSGSVYLSGLAAGTHTVKIQIYTEGSGQSAYCRPVTAEPSRESLGIQVVEHK